MQSASEGLSPNAQAQYLWSFRTYLRNNVSIRFYSIGLRLEVKS